MQASLPRRGLPALFWAVPVVVLLAIVGLWLALSARPAPTPAPATMPISQAIEARWGIRIKRVAVTSAGGMVDLRYTVIDSNKAQTMLELLDTTPKIIDRASGQTIELHQAPSHGTDMEAGRSYFILYANPKGALKPGSIVTITVGDLKLEPVVVN